MIIIWKMTCLLRCYQVLIILILLFAITCIPYVRYAPDPVKDVHSWVSHFDQQKSFSYTYKMKTLTTEVHASGVCIIGRAEHIT